VKRTCLYHGKTRRSAGCEIENTAARASLLISTLFDDLVDAVDAARREDKLLQDKPSEPTLDIYAHRNTPVRLFAEAIYTSRQAKIGSFRLMGAVERKTLELHCDDPHEVEGRPIFWWKCHQEARDDRSATSLEFVDLGAVGPIHLAEMQGGFYARMVGDLQDDCSREQFVDIYRSRWVTWSPGRPYSPYLSRQNVP